MEGSYANVTDLKIEGSEVARVAFKPSPFWETDPELWFLQLESQFKLAGISADETMFHSVIASIDTKRLMHVKDIISSPPDKNKYGAIKNVILSSFAQSESSKLRLLLQDLTLGDKRPSQLLLEMQNLASSKINDDVVRTLWLQRLPTHMQQILSICKEPLKVLAEIADKISEIPDTLNVVSSSVQSVESLKREISELKHQVQRFSRTRKHVSQHVKDRARSRSKSKSSKLEKKFCWYHYKFADKALKCKKPCSYPGNE